jgi:hypothetical protein
MQRCHSLAFHERFGWTAVVVAALMVSQLGCNCGGGTEGLADAGSNPLGVTWGGLPGAWTFGYAVYDSQGLYSMVPFDQVVDSGTLLMLQRAGYVTSGDPTVFRNLQAVTWAGVPPGGIALHPGPLPNADDAIIRFSAPRAGPYRFVGAYGAGDIGATLDRIHTASGFQDHSDPNFAFDFTVILDAGEPVDWMVGNAGSYVGDSTPLEMTSVTGPLALP